MQWDEVSPGNRACFLLHSKSPCYKWSREVSARHCLITFAATMQSWHKLLTSQIVTTDQQVELQGLRMQHGQVTGLHACKGHHCYHSCKVAHRASGHALRCARGTEQVLALQHRRSRNFHACRRQYTAAAPVQHPCLHLRYDTLMLALCERDNSGRDTSSASQCLQYCHPCTNRAMPGVSLMQNNNLHLVRCTVQAHGCLNSP